MAEAAAAETNVPPRKTRKERARIKRISAIARHQRIMRDRDETELSQRVEKLYIITSTLPAASVLRATQCQHHFRILTDEIEKFEDCINSHRYKRKTSPEVQALLKTPKENMQAFLQWVNKHGGVMTGIEIAEFEGYGMGMKVVEDISESSIVIKLPRKLMMSSELAYHTPLRTLIEKDEMLKEMPNVLLAIFLLYEKFKLNSFWKPYIDILPKTYTSLLNFTEDELEELKGSPSHFRALLIMRSISRQYAHFHRIFDRNSDAPVSCIMRPRFTYKEYIWAVATVMSRQNVIPTQDGKEECNVLIPLWDFCNHKNGVYSTEYDPKTKMLTCKSFADYKTGEQFFIYYGERSNANFFMHNGFVYDDNKDDVYSIKLGISKMDDLFLRKSMLLGKLKIPLSSEFTIRRKPEPIDGNLLAFARVFNMKQPELIHWLGNFKHKELSNFDCDISTELNNKAWSFLKTRLQLTLGTYPTTYDEDQELLDEGGERMTPNRILAIRMRMTEKRLLIEAMDFASKQIKE